MPRAWSQEVNSACPAPSLRSTAEPRMLWGSHSGLSTFYRSFHGLLVAKLSATSARSCSVAHVPRGVLVLLDWAGSHPWTSPFGRARLRSGAPSIETALRTRAVVVPTRPLKVLWVI